jgi:uncharacterized repeat protein (TIGR01451 family)
LESLEQRALLATTLYSCNFGTPEYAAGPLDGQQGWTAAVASGGYANVATDNPIGGSPSDLHILSPVVDGANVSAPLVDTPSNGHTLISFSVCVNSLGAGNDLGNPGADCQASVMFADSSGVAVNLQQGEAGAASSVTIFGNSASGSTTFDVPVGPVNFGKYDTFLFDWYQGATSAENTFTATYDGTICYQSPAGSAPAAPGPALIGFSADGVPAGPADVDIDNLLVQSGSESPTLAVTSSHTDPFKVGDIGDPYSIVVSNSGSAVTSGAVTLTDTLPTGLSPNSADTGTIDGWSVSTSGQTVTAARSDALDAGASYPTLPLLVDVGAVSSSPVDNTVVVSGGGASGTATATDPTNVVSPGLAVTVSHTDPFKAGDTGDPYSITVSNTGSVATSGTITLTDTLPTGLTPNSADTGTIDGWAVSTSGQTVTAARSDALDAGASYPTLPLLVDVGDVAASPVANTVVVSGGGVSVSATATDPTNILMPDLAIAMTHNDPFDVGDTGDLYSITVSNTGTGPTSGTVTVTDTLPTDLTPDEADMLADATLSTALTPNDAGTGTDNGWLPTVNGNTVTATRSDPLAAGASYPAFELACDVGKNPMTNDDNTAVASGGDTPDDATADNLTNIVVPSLGVVSSHKDPFLIGDTGDAYTITVTNTGDTATAAGRAVTMVDTLPTGLTATAMSGSGWSCSIGAEGATATATYTGSIEEYSSFPDLILTVNVTSNATTATTGDNVATVLNGGSTGTVINTMTDKTTIIPQPVVQTINADDNALIGKSSGGQPAGEYPANIWSAGSSTVGNPIAEGIDLTGGPGGTMANAWPITINVGPQPQGVDWDPVVAVTYSYANNNGCFSRTGAPLSNSVIWIRGADAWSPTIALPAPTQVGQYTLTLEVRLFDPNKMQSPDDLSNPYQDLTTTYNVYATMFDPVDIIYTAVPSGKGVPNKQADIMQENWLQVATQWASGATTPAAVAQDLMNGIYNNSGWSYYTSANPWFDMPALGAVDSGGIIVARANCIEVSNAWMNLSKVLGLADAATATYSQLGLGSAFVLDAGPAFGPQNGNLFAPGSSTPVGWLFSCHQIGVYGGMYYDPTFNESYPVKSAGELEICAINSTVKQGSQTFYGGDGGQTFVAGVTDSGGQVTESDSSTTNLQMYTWTNYSSFVPQVARPAVTAAAGASINSVTFQGADSTGDGFFDALDAEVTVNVATPGTYYLSGVLEQGTQIVTARSDVDSDNTTSATVLATAAGTQTVALPFSGEDIFQSGLDGVFTAAITLAGANGTTDGGTYNTQTLNHTQFGELPVRIGTVTDSGGNTASNGTFGSLAAQVNLSVAVTGSYQIGGALYSSSGTLLATTSQIYTATATGAQAANLSFDGPTIRTAGADGPYSIVVTIDDGNGGQVDSQTHTTAAYHATDFSAPGDFFTSVYTDQGVDTNGNGKFDVLQINAGVTIGTAGNYNFFGQLCDPAGAVVATAWATEDFTPGTWSVPLDFSGTSIYANSANGPYTLKSLLLQPVGGSPEDAVGTAYTTGAYQYTEFEYAPRTNGLDVPALYNPVSSTFYLPQTNNPAAGSGTAFGYGMPNAGWIPLQGDWAGTGSMGVGLYNPTTSTFYLTSNLSSGIAEYSFGYGVPSAGWIPLAGDWNGSGQMGVGLYNPTTSTFFLTEALTTGFAQYCFSLGTPGDGDIPLVGDWDGTGVTGVGVYDPKTSCFYLTQSLTTGAVDHAFGFGQPGGGWTPIVGDWNGDGAAGVGLYDPQHSGFYLTNALTTGMAQNTFGYGQPNGGWTPIVGDWNASGKDGVGLFVPQGSTLYLTDTLATGFAEITIKCGVASGSCLPVTGTGLTADLTATSIGQSASQSSLLDSAQLSSIETAAIAGWAAAGAPADALAAMSQSTLDVVNLPGAALAQAAGNHITISATAAGNGWFVDPTPASNTEFTQLGSIGELQAVDPQAVDRIDLLTVVEHELGRVAGLDDLGSSATSLMSGSLGTGIRRIPGPTEIDAILTE